jgi:hypothetical protein
MPADGELAGPDGLSEPRLLAVPHDAKHMRTLLRLRGARGQGLRGRHSVRRRRRGGRPEFGRSDRAGAIACPRRRQSETRIW